MAGQIDPLTAERLRKRGAIIHPIEVARTSMSIAGLLTTFFGVRRMIRRIEPDVIIAYTIKPVVLGALANRRARFVAVITGLGFAFTAGFGWKRRIARVAAILLYRTALRKADIVLFQNPDDRADLRSHGALPCKSAVGLLSGSGVEIDRFAPSPLPSACSFLMASRLLGDKGVREFGAAAAIVKRDLPECDIALAGFFDSSPDSLDPAELDRMVAAGVRYLGHLDDVRPAIAQCSVYVLPSYREGTPRSVLEAMAMGRAIITSDAPGCRETVVHGVNGLLVPSRDSAALVAAMKQLAHDPALVRQMGLQSRRMAEERFDVRHVNEAILQYAHLA